MSLFIVHAISSADMSMWPVDISKLESNPAGPRLVTLTFFGGSESRRCCINNHRNVWISNYVCQVQKVTLLLGNFLGNWKVFGKFEYFSDKDCSMGHLARYPTRNVQNSLKAFQAVLKLPIQAGKSPGSLETFQSFWQLSSLNFLYCILYFVWHFSTPGKNFLVVHNTSWGKMVNWAQFFFFP